MVKIPQHKVTKSIILMRGFSRLRLFSHSSESTDGESLVYIGLCCVGRQVSKYSFGEFEIEVNFLELIIRIKAKNKSNQVLKNNNG